MLSLIESGRYAPRLLASLFVLLVFSCHTEAQEFLNPGTTTLRGYEPAGVTIDDFRITQYLSSGVAYDSNILQSHAHNIQDVIFFVAPTIDILHEDKRNVQEVVVSTTTARYFDDVSDNYTNFFVSANNTYLLSPTSQIFGVASFFDGYQRRISRNFDIPTDAAAPVPETILLGSIGYKQSGLKWDAGISVTGSGEDFSNIRSISGGLVNQTFRNERDILLDSYFNIQLSSRIKSNLSVQASDTEYQLQIRNYDQWRVADTITADLTSKTSIGFLAGVRDQNTYDNPLLHLGTLMEYEGQAYWNPTRILSFEARAGYKDLGVDYVAGVFAGGFSYYYKLNAKYLIWSDLQLESGLGFEKRYLAGNTDIENILTSRVAINYELSSYAGLSFLINSQAWNSRTPFNTFNESTVQTSLNLRF